MKKITFFIVVVVVYLLSSCIPSLHSIVNEENRIVDDRILGDWQDKSEENAIWKFRKASILTFENEKLQNGVLNWSNTEIGDPEISIERLKNIYPHEDINITKKEDLPYYVLMHQESEDENSKAYMKVEMTKIDGILYMDVYPLDIAYTGWRFASNYIGGHTFAKVEFSGGRMTISAFDGSFIENLIENKKIRLKHEVVDGDIILTASTEELRAFITKYGKKEELFDDSEELTAYNE